MGCNDALSIAPLLARPVRAHVARMSSTISLHRPAVSGHAQRAQRLLSLPSLAAYPALRVWLERVEAQPSFAATMRVGGP
jgi:glutathione S-transferase